jgi:transcriptional regulator with XRE-family HTH domain
MHIEILVKKVRKEKDVTLNTLSKKCGVSVSHINDIENNLKMPSLVVLVKISKALNTSIQELYNVEW